MPNSVGLRALFLSVVGILIVASPAIFAHASAIVTANAHDGSVTVAQVASDGPGWIVIQADRNGAPGPALGYTAVSGGENGDVVVDIETTQATSTLYAVLHRDAGRVGAYEFPGPDVPVSVIGQVVTQPFTVTDGEGSGPRPAMGVAFEYWLAALLLITGTLLSSGALVTSRVRVRR
jgi:hypothetical protein